MKFNDDITDEEADGEFECRSKKQIQRDDDFNAWEIEDDYE